MLMGFFIRKYDPSIQRFSIQKNEDNIEKKNYREMLVLAASSTFSSFSVMRPSDFAALP